MKNYEENKKWTFIKQQKMTCVNGSSNGRGISDIEKKKEIFQPLDKIHTYVYIYNMSKNKSNKKL